MDSAYIEILNTNKELRKELADEISENKLKDKKLKSLSRELESCYRTLSHQDSAILAHEDEIASLKSDIKSLKQQLHKALQDLRHKGNASTAQDIHILRLEDKVDQLKKRIREITDKKLSQNNNSPMALPDLLANIGTALDRIENSIGGDTTIDPINTLNGIRITITTIRGHMQRTAQEAVNYHDLLNTANGRINNLMNDLTNVRNDLLLRTQMLTQALLDEQNERRHWQHFVQDLQTNGQRIAFRKQNQINILLQEKVAQQLLYRRKARQYQQCYADKGLLEYNRDRLNDRYLKWKAKEINSRQIILNLQNNPLGNMAEARRQPLYNIIGPIFAKHEQYSGQEPPDEYLDKVWNSISHLEPNMVALENANVNDFNDLIKCGLLKSKLGGKYLPIPANDPYTAGNPAINSPATLRAWMRAKYQRETIGTQQSAIQRLSQERFLPTDSPDTYEKRIRPLLLGVANNDATAISFLKNHLSGDFYTWMKIANPANIDAYFTELKNLWLERNPAISLQIPIQQLAPEALPSQPQKSETDEDWLQLAKDLAYTGISKDHSVLKAFVYEELQKRLGNKTAHVRKSPFTPKSVYTTKKIVRKVAPKASSKLDRHCSTCGKTGHRKTNCPKVKRVKKVNYVIQDDFEDPDDSEEYILDDDSPEEVLLESDDEIIDSDDDDNQRNCYALKKKVEQSGVPMKKKISPTSKSRKGASGNIVMRTEQVYQIALKSIISSIVPHCPKEILVEISKFINTIYPKLKDPCLNTVMENDTVKRKELAWKNVTNKIQEVLFPLIQATNSEQKLLLQVPESEVSNDVIMADSAKIKEVNTSSFSHVLPERLRLDQAIKAYAQCHSAEKKIAKYIGPSL